MPNGLRRVDRGIELIHWRRDRQIDTTCKDAVGQVLILPTKRIQQRRACMFLPQGNDLRGIDIGEKHIHHRAGSVPKQARPGQTPSVIHLNMVGGRAFNCQRGLKLFDPVHSGASAQSASSLISRAKRTPRSSRIRFWSLSNMSSNEVSTGLAVGAVSRCLSHQS